MEIRKYTDIERLKDKYALAFHEGEHIVCQEKIDGANASFCYDSSTNTLVAFSRRKQLDEANGLNGFYEFVSNLNVDSYKTVLGDELIIFGEWLIPHTVKYPESKYRNFYVFDVFDRRLGHYLPWSETKRIAEVCGLQTVPLFYDGPFTSWDDIYKLVGQTKMEASPVGEGQVVKSQDRLDNKSSNTPSYVKIVAAKFSEVHQSKPHEVDPEKLAAKQAAEALAATIITERRIQKLIEKAVDEGRLRADWDEKDLGTIAKFLGKDVYADCVKEEPETVAQIENFGKIAAGIAMKLARGLVK